MSSLSVLHDSQDRIYTGGELKPHYLLNEFHLKGDALVAFEGECEVQTHQLVDWEDRLRKDHIRAKKMVHFLGEFFGWQLREGVLLQRLLIAQSFEVLSELCAQGKVWRQGDDLFAEGPEGEKGKLSVSIATASPVSVLIHLGINVDSEGAPVRALGLNDLGISSQSLISSILESFSEEYSSVKWACAKVRPVM